jgi:hypothetical protein
MKLQSFLSLYTGFLIIGLGIVFMISSVAAQNMTQDASEGNLTVSTMVTNGTVANTTNSSTPLITNTT